MLGNTFGYDDISVHDRLVRAWENSMELTRYYEMYSKRMPEGELSEMFKEFAKDEALHASKLRSILDNNKTNQ